MKISSLFLGLALTAWAVTGCEKKKGDDPNLVAKTGELSIEMEHVVGAGVLKLATAPTTYDYATPSGDPFNVTTFRYYVSNIRLRRADGTEYVQPNSYYLVDEAKPAYKLLTIKDVPVGDYTGLSFLIGVDAPRNTAGVQENALAPSDMFWSWTTGYIFVKMEGYSPVATSSTRFMQFHIGGFEGPNNALKTVSPALPAGVKVLVRADHSPAIHLKVDVLKMFTGPNTVRFGSFAIPHGPGANAVKIAENYAAGMFTVEHVYAN
ncbi:MbnP family protein [Hymenobacter algoricola]|uniref:Copper-binding protein MbnP-like domain-containing protein n=1 Tax=Hymenobacter algoricola TaxID=486267 RepID=A0ABP7NSS0_9BACT